VVPLAEVHPCPLDPQGGPCRCDSGSVRCRAPEAQITVNTRRRQKVYEYLLSEPGEVVFATPNGPVRIRVEADGGLRISGEGALTLELQASNVINLKVEEIG